MMSRLTRYLRLGRGIPLTWIVLLLASLDSASVFGLSARTDSEKYALHSIPQPNLERLEEAVRKRLREAQDDFNSLAQDPEVPDDQFAEAYGDLGGVYHAHHLSDSAEACYQNAQLLSPNDYRWPYLLGYLYQQAPQLELAVTQYRRVLALRPGDPLTQLRLAQVYLDLDQPGQAEALLTPIVTIEALKGPTAFALGEALFAQGRPLQAVRQYRQALEAQPSASRIHYALAMAYRTLGDIDQARQHLAQRGDVEPQVPDPLVSELDLLMSGGRTHRYRAIEAALAKQFDVATEEFRQAVAATPEDVAARVNLARALYMIGDQDGAYEQLSVAVKLDPTHAQANYFMGRLAEERGLDTQAMAYYRAAIASNPGHGGAHNFLANGLMRQKDYAQAASHYAKVVELVPNDPKARLMQAMALVATGARYAEARDRLQAACEAYPEDPALVRALARLLAASPDDQVRNGARALALANPLFAQTNSIENAQTVAMAYAELGQYADAAAYQQAAIDAAVKLGAFQLLPGLNVNLERYRNNQPCRTPWPADDPLFYPEYSGGV